MGSHSRQRSAPAGKPTSKYKLSKPVPASSQHTVLRNNRRPREAKLKNLSHASDSSRFSGRLRAIVRFIGFLLSNN